MKYLTILMIAMFALPAVSAATFFGNNVIDKLSIVQKNPTDWSTIENGAYGIVQFNTVTTPWGLAQERIKVSVWNLEPKTSYQLIYYGNDEVNDVWPYATCIGNSRMTNTQGYFSSGSTAFKHLSMRSDSINQKFWIILSSDVNCTAGKMIAWNPDSYLFETRTV